MGFGMETFSSKKHLKELEPQTPDLSAARWVQDCFYRSRMKAFPRTKMRRLSVQGYEAAEILLHIRSPEEIEAIINWVFCNPFWASIVVSVPKLVKYIKPIETRIVKGSYDPSEAIIKPLESNYSPFRIQSRENKR